MGHVRTLEPEVLQMFESLHNSIGAAFGNIRLKPLARPVLELSKQGKVVGSGSHPVTLASSPIKRRNVVLAASFSLFHNGCSISITVPHARGLISITLSQPNRR